jgi:ferrochelatase
MTLDPIHSFFDHPLLIAAFAEQVRAAAPAAGEDVIFTAHSLPTRVIKAGDRYATEVARTARAIAAAVRLVRYRRAFQSAGRTPEPWIGLDLSDLIRHRAARGTTAFLVVPIGFVCDHTEILFDIDVQARQTAEDCGVRLRRTASLNTSPSFIAALEALVREALVREALVREALVRETPVRQTAAADRL